MQAQEGGREDRVRTLADQIERAERAFKGKFLPISSAVTEIIAECDSTSRISATMESAKQLLETFSDTACTTFLESLAAMNGLEEQLSSDEKKMLMAATTYLQKSISEMLCSEHKELPKSTQPAVEALEVGWAQTKMGIVQIVLHMAYVSHT